jgi:CRISPR-associated protein Cas6
MSASLRASEAPAAEAPPAVDIVFDLAGSTLPAEHAWALLQAISVHLPWLAEDPRAGVHPLRTVPTGYGEVLLPQRTKLALRVAEERTGDALRLAHARLAVGDCTLVVGAGRARILAPSATVAAQRVAGVARDPAAFETEVARWMAMLRIEAHVIAGRPRHGRAGERELAGYAVTVHGLRAEDSLRLQYEGLGGERNVGWGLFVPAKAIAAGIG